MNIEDIEKQLFVENNIKHQVTSKNDAPNALKDRDLIGTSREKINHPLVKMDLYWAIFQMGGLLKRKGKNILCLII